MSLTDFIVLFVTAQTLFIPILGGLFMGIRAERMKQSRLFLIATQRVRWGGK